MTQYTSDSSDDKKEAASFFSKWMSFENKGEGWDEVCLQWCKQKSAARKENADPNCSMLCFNRPVSEKAFDSNDKWNPLKGYTISVVSGKNDCTSHINDMSESKDITQTGSNQHDTKYKLDLGDVWTQADIKAKQLVNDKVVPLYNSTIEQAVAFKDSSEAAQLQGYIKTKTNDLLNQIYPMSPFNVDGKSDVTTPPNPKEKN